MMHKKYIRILTSWNRLFFHYSGLHVGTRLYKPNLLPESVRDTKSKMLNNIIGTKYLLQRDDVITVKNWHNFLFVDIHNLWWNLSMITFFFTQKFSPEFQYYFTFNPTRNLESGTFLATIYKQSNLKTLIHFTYCRNLLVKAALSAKVKRCKIYNMLWMRKKTKNR